MPDALFSLFNRLASDAYDPLVIIIELLLIGLSVSWVLAVLQGTRGTRPLKGLLAVLVVVFLIVQILAVQYRWTRLELLYRYFLIGMAFVALVAFQPELRRAVIRAGDVRLGRRGSSRAKLIATLVKAAGDLSRNRHGALIAIERNVDLRGWAENGTMINAEVTPKLLGSIFYPKSPLHDLGVIIRDNTLVAANCQFPSAESDEVQLSLGSRHLAALGMSYESDALILVVSEETGTISLADNGQLLRYLSLDDLAHELATRLGEGEGPAAARQSRRHRAWRIVRRALVAIPLTIVIWSLADQATQIQADNVAVEVVLKPAPDRVLDVLEPPSRRFAVTFRGSTRAVESLRALAGADALRVEWTPPEGYAAAGEYSKLAEEIIGNSALVRARGVSVLKVTPPALRFAVDEVVTLNLPVVPARGSTRIADVRFDPPEVAVTLRQRDAARLTEDQRVVEARLEDSLKTITGSQTVTLDRIPLAPDVGGVRPVRIEPAEVDVSLRVVERLVRRPLSGVVVQFLASPTVWQRYDIVLADVNELRLDIEVEGDRAAVEALRPQDIRAFLPVSSDLVAPAPEFRSVEVVVPLPAGVTLVGPPRTVQLRLQERPSPVP